MKILKRPKTIILLMVIYAYFFIRGIGSALLFSSNPNYYLFNQAGIGFLYFILSIPVLILTGVTLQYLWKPKPIGFWIALSGIALGFVSNLISFFIGLANPELMQQAYILSREARGLPVRPERIEQLLSPTGIIITLGVTLSISLILVALFIWKRNYFFQEEATEVQMSTSHP